MAYTGEQKREYQRNWIKNRRAAWIVENGPCVRCGSSDNLEVDHIDKALKVRNVSQLWSMSEANPIRVSELLKCQVLCSSCHRDKTNRENRFPCADRKSARKGCKCDDCRILRRDEKRRQRSIRA